MPDSDDRTEKSDNVNAQEKMRAALVRSVAEIKTPAQARDTLDSLEKTAGDLLHCFHKKTKKTSEVDIRLAKKRYADLLRHLRETKK
jgi:phage-related protein